MSNNPHTINDGKDAMAELLMGKNGYWFKEVGSGESASGGMGDYGPDTVKKPCESTCQKGWFTNDKYCQGEGKSRKCYSPHQGGKKKRRKSRKKRTKRKPKRKRRKTKRRKRKRVKRKSSRKY